MSGILSNFVGSSRESLPELSYVTNIFLGNRSANTPYTTTVNIGDPHPNRRLVIYNYTDYFSSSPNNPVLSQKCYVNGNLLTRITDGGRAEGFVVSTAFDVYAGNSSMWVSDKIPAGTTATLEFDSTARAYWGPLGIMKVINLDNSVPQTAGVVSAPWDLTVNSGSFVIFNARASALNAFNTATTISNATNRFREGTGAPNPTTAPYAGFDYQNTGQSSATLSFTPDSSTYRYFLFNRT
jgi:hypothetical protein